MTKLQQAIDAVKAADQKITWDMAGECIVVRTEFFESDGKTAGTIERHYLNDNPPTVEPLPEPVEGGDVTVGLDGAAAVAEGEQL